MRLTVHTQVEMERFCSPRELFSYLHPAPFTKVRGRGILRSTYTECCIAAVLTGQDRRSGPPLLDLGDPHVVVLHGYAEEWISEGPSL
jgi:hypothetical protein